MPHHTFPSSEFRLPIAFLLFSLLSLSFLPACDDEPDESSTSDDDVGESSPDPQGPDCPTTEEEPDGLFLTWQDDPTTTMTIDWHVDPVEGDAPEPRTSLCLRHVDDSPWTEEVEGQLREVPQYERKVFRAELADLEPDEEYVFQVGHFEREFRFRTMPEDIDDEPLVFAAGGDTMHMPQLFASTNEAVMEYDPRFILWGGDLAYADGGTDPGTNLRWSRWFDAILKTLVTDDGRAIPIIASVGNHEVVDGYYFNHDDYERTDQWRRQLAPLYYSLFAFPGQPGYGVLDFGDYLSVVVLDTDHTNPIEGAQAGWLQSTLSERQDRGVEHIFPIYHVAAFPSHRDFDGSIKARIRDAWVPHFEEYGVELAFENHDHTYKRTHPIRGGEVDEEDGIVYVGDGAWGVFPRPGDSSDEWYIAEFADELHGLVVTIHGEHHHVKAVDQQGTVLDEYGAIP